MKEVRKIRQKKGEKLNRERRRRRRRKISTTNGIQDT